MSYYPRSATVRAKTDCVMLEMLRNVLDILQRNKTFRAQLERNYRARALDTHLRSVPIFSSLTERLHRSPARSRRTHSLLARRGHLPPG